MKQREDLEEASNRNTESLRERLRKEKDALTETLEKTNDFLLFEEVKFGKPVTCMSVLIVICIVLGGTLCYSAVAG